MLSLWAFLLTCSFSSLALATPAEEAQLEQLDKIERELELQRDWARAETYEMTTGVAKKYGGAYGLGIIYAKSMFGASEGH